MDRRELFRRVGIGTAGVAGVTGLATMGCVGAEAQEARGRIYNSDLFKKHLFPLFGDTPQRDISIGSILEGPAFLFDSRERSRLLAQGVTIDVSGVALPRDRELDIRIPTGEAFKKAQKGREMRAYVMGRDGRFFDRRHGMGVGLFERDGQLIYLVHMEVKTEGLAEIKERGMTVYLTEEPDTRGPNWGSMGVDKTQIKPVLIYNISPPQRSA